MGCSQNPTQSSSGTACFSGHILATMAFERYVRAMVHKRKQGLTLETIVSERSASSLRAFRNDVEQAFPGLLDGMLLFGSRARGDARKNSDFDVAVLLNCDDRPDDMRNRLSDIAFPYIKAGVHIRPVAVLAKHVQQAGPFAVIGNIAREGVAIR